MVIEKVETEKEKRELKAAADKMGKLLAVIRQNCIDTYFDFFVEFWDIVSSDELVLNWHIKKICDKLQEYAEKVIRGEKANDLIINIPPGMSKSTMVSVMLQPWIWLHKPDCVVINSSYSADLSTDHSIRSKMIYKSERYQMYFAKHFAKEHGRYMHLIKDNERNWINNYGGARIATSSRGSITGKHGHIILRDDPINPEQSESSVYRDQVNRFNDRTLSNRKKDKEKVPTITVMQRLHMDDSTGHDLKKTKKTIEHIKLPAQSSDEVLPKEWELYYKNGYLDPVRLSQDVLDGQLEDLQSVGYAGQYRQQPSPGEGSIFKRSWFKIIPLNATPFDWREKPMKFMIDGAFTEKTQNDPSAQMAYWVHEGKLYIRMCNFVRNELPKYLKFIDAFLRRYHYGDDSIIRVEMKSSGPAVKTMLAQEEYGSYNTARINDTHVSWGKVTRGEYASPSVESGKVYLIRGGWNEAFISQCADFPNDPHDDMYDLLCYAVLQELSKKSFAGKKTVVNLGGRII